MKQREIITTAEARVILGKTSPSGKPVSVQRVKQLINMKRFPGAKRSGRFWLLPKDEVLAVAKSSGEYNARVKRKKSKA